MKIRTSRQPPGDQVSFGPTPARVIKDAKNERERVLKRLQALIETHRESALRMDVALEAADILKVIDALESEATQGDPMQLLSCEDEVRQYARFSLYDEILGEPSNVFLATPVSADTVRYEAMPRTFWLDCLRALRKAWEPQPSARPDEDAPTAP